MVHVLFSCFLQVLDLFPEGEPADPASVAEGRQCENICDISQESSCYLLDGRHVACEPVEVGGLSHYLQGFIHAQAVSPTFSINSRITRIVGTRQHPGLFAIFCVFFWQAQFGGFLC